MFLQTTGLHILASSSNQSLAIPGSLPPSWPLLAESEGKKSRALEELLSKQGRLL